MWNESSDFFQHMMLIRGTACRMIRKEIAKDFLQVWADFRQASKCHWILLQRKTIWMVRLGLGKIFPGLAFRQ